jgi:hypothetical protein
LSGSGAPGDPAIKEPSEFGRAFHVGVLQTFDFETCLPDQRRDIAVQMTSAEHSLLDTIQAFLPAGDAGIVGMSMLDEIEATSGFRARKR